MSTTLDKVRAKVIEAVPEIGKKRWWCRTCDARSFFGKESLHIFDCEKPDPVEETFPGRPITLADVLRAIEATPDKDGTLLIDTSGQWFGLNSKLALARGGYLHRELNWNLSLPLDEQEPEVVEFIAKVLDV